MVKEEEPRADADYKLSNEVGSNPTLEISIQKNTNQSNSGDLPGLQGALAYLTSQAELDACGRLFQVYLGQIQAGRSQEQATLAATAQYQQDWLSGRLQLSAACAAADRTWRQEYAHGRDPLLPAARAYIEADPAVSPCKSAATDYINAVVAGRSPVDASLAAFDAFAAAMAQQPSGAADETCVKSAMAYVAESSIPEGPTKAAMEAYIAHVMQGGGQAYDPHCMESARAFINVHLRGGSLEQANEAAAVTFFNALAEQGAAWDENTACSQAAKAFIDLYSP